MRKGESKKKLLASYLGRVHPLLIGEAEWSAIAAGLAPVSDSYLRSLLRECGVPLEPLIEGVRQDSLPALERTLRALESAYETGDAAQRRACRERVIAAKDHARFAIRRLPESGAKKIEKEEMLLWMLTWLENPPAFPLWLDLRKRQLAE